MRSEGELCADPILIWLPHYAIVLARAEELRFQFIAPGPDLPFPGSDDAL